MTKIYVTPVTNLLPWCLPFGLYLECTGSAMKGEWWWNIQCHVIDNIIQALLLAWLASKSYPCLTPLFLLYCTSSYMYAIFWLSNHLSYLTSTFKHAQVQLWPIVSVKIIIVHIKHASRKSPGTLLSMIGTWSKQALYSSRRFLWVMQHGVVHVGSLLRAL